MQRIHVTGNAGSGKSTAAHLIGRALNLPIYGLDQIVWQEGWQTPSVDLRRERESDLVSKPAWVIEGVSQIVRRAADTIIFLDVPRRTSYLRCAKRNWRYLLRSRPGLPDNCPEILIIPRLARIIWKFQHSVRPAILEDLKRPGITAFHITNDMQLASALDELAISGKVGLAAESWQVPTNSSTLTRRVSSITEK